MFVFNIVILASAAVPLAVAWRANRGTTLRHALGWAWLAWAAWLTFGIWPGLLTNYAALTLTSCAGIAVFGARRPGLVAWDFVVGSLLIVLWIGWAEGLLSGTELKLGIFRFVFLCALLAVAVLNYIPTRMFRGAGVLSLGLFLALHSLFKNSFNDSEYVLFFPAMASWMACSNLKIRPRLGSEADEIWKRFRDRFGAVWAERVREQFNRAAHNAGWPVQLGWNGFITKEESIRVEWVETLKALQKRFEL